MTPLNPIQVRTANPNDLYEIMDLQNSYVNAGFVGMLREKPFDIEESKIWFSQFSESSSHQLLIASDGNNLLGYTASFSYRGGGVFSKTVETSIYTSLVHQSRGAGSVLYKTLFERISNFDLHLAVVGIALPNDKSISLHKKFNFEEVGTLNEYAYFKNSYVSSLWMQKRL
jgi:phosphinothricin acetyltransferase